MSKKADELTPMMRQFRELKSKHPDALLLFRCGDFYETYCDDAEVAAKILHITLTHRNKGAAQGEAMAGFPYHALDTHLPKLIRAGQRVAICDQLEDPKKTKTLVKRGITELVTPGVAMQDNVLENKENNFLCAVHTGRGAVGLAFLDISTGEFLCGEGSYDYAVKAIENFRPKEVLYERRRRQEFLSRFPARLCTYELDDWAFSSETAEKKLCTHFSVKSLKGFGIDHLKNGIAAAGAIMGYLEFTEHKMLGHITGISRLDTDRFVRLDTFTVRSLEIIQPMTEGGASLLSIVDNTATAMGGRLLRRWLTFPLKDVERITARHNVVEEFFRDSALRDIVQEQLQR
ncbi:MAG: DNA mismatch repair protein MutS, partial [Prevotella sp.]|nr:DNA mismatch repair protein MutS [Prevotella sp.]